MAFFLAPGIAMSQQLARVGWISPGSQKGLGYLLDAFKQGMRETGLTEAKDYVMDEQWADGRYERFPDMTKAVIARKPRVIVVGTIASVRVAQRLTKTIPIVFCSVNDPVGSGLVKTLARPGGNTTGVATLSEETTVKQLQILHEVVPKATRIAVLANPGNPSNLDFYESAAAASPSLGVTLHRIDVKAPEEVEIAFTSMLKVKARALLVLPDGALMSLRESICMLALKNRLPVMGSPDFAAVGGLVGFGSVRTENYRLAGTYMKKIFGGLDAGEIPVEQARKIELWINSATAHALGLKIPAAVMGRVDKIVGQRL